MKWLIKLLKYVAGKLQKTYRTTIDAIKNFRENPIDNFRDALFGITLAIILLNLVSSVTLFAVQGGYANQIAAITGHSASGGIDSPFQIGNRVFELFYSGVLWNIGWILILIQIAFLVFLAIWKSKPAQKVVLSIDLAFTLILGLCAAVYQGINRRIISLSQEQETQLVELFQRSGQTIITVFFALCAVVGTLFIIIVLLKAECRAVLKNTLISSSIFVLLCPLILCIVGNIIPLVFAIVLGLIIAGVFSFILSGVGGSGGGASPAPTKSTPSAKGSAPSTKSSPIVIRLERGVEVYKVHGFQHDYIERRNSLDGYSEICSLNDLRRGRFVIYDASGRQLSEKNIPWRS